MGIARQVKQQALGATRKVVTRLLADEQRALRIARALGTVQRGRQALDRGQDELLRALGFAPRGDFKSVGRKLAGLKRRLRELDSKLEALLANKR